MVNRGGHEQCAELFNSVKTLDQKIKLMRARLGVNWMPRLDLVETIQAAAIAVFGISKEQMFSGGKTQDVAYARMASMAICREKTHLSRLTIARLHGRTDHSTVSYAERSLKNGKEHLIAAAAEIRRLITFNSKCGDVAGVVPSSFHSTHQSGNRLNRTRTVHLPRLRDGFEL